MSRGRRFGNAQGNRFYNYPDFLVLRQVKMLEGAENPVFINRVYDLRHGTTPLR